MIEPLANVQCLMIVAMYKPTQSSKTRTAHYGVHTFVPASVKGWEQLGICANRDLRTAELKCVCSRVRVRFLTGPCSQL